MHNTAIDSPVSSYTLDEKKKKENPFLSGTFLFKLYQENPQLFRNKAVSPLVYTKKSATNEKHSTNATSIMMISRAGLRHAAMTQQSPPRTASSNPSSGSFHA